MSEYPDVPEVAAARLEMRRRQALREVTYGVEQIHLYGGDAYNYGEARQKLASTTRAVADAAERLAALYDEGDDV